MVLNRSVLNRCVNTYLKETAIHTKDQRANKYISKIISKYFKSVPPDRELLIEKSKSDKR